MNDPDPYCLPDEKGHIACPTCRAVKDATTLPFLPPAPAAEVPTPRTQQPGGLTAPSGSPERDGLSIKLADGKLVISIGVKTLAWAAEGANHGPLEGWRIKTGREAEWAVDVIREMEYENGDFNSVSRITQWLDEMMRLAAESGSAALDHPEGTAPDAEVPTPSGKKYMTVDCLLAESSFEVKAEYWRLEMLRLAEENAALREELDERRKQVGPFDPTAECIKLRKELIALETVARELAEAGSEILECFYMAGEPNLGEAIDKIRPIIAKFNALTK